MQYDICVEGWGGELSPYFFLNIWTAGNPNNFTGFQNPEYDRLLKEVMHIQDKEKRFSQFRDAEERLLDFQAVIPLFFNSKVFLIDERVRNWHVYMSNSTQFKDVYLDE
jgi:oligopeptide transport system substrate-binding protein